MLTYLAKRLLMMIPLLLGITIISFTVIHLAPGEPTDIQTELNPKASTELQERLRAQYDLDKPLLRSVRQVAGADRPARLRRVLFPGPSAGGRKDRRAAAGDDPHQRPVDRRHPRLRHPHRHPLGHPPQFPVRSRHHGLRLPRFRHPQLLVGAADDGLLRGAPRLVPHRRAQVPRPRIPRLLGADRRLRQPPGAAGLHLRLRRACRLFPLHALQHARGDPPGLHPHRPRQGALRARGHLPPRPAQRPACRSSPSSASRSPA